MKFMHGTCMKAVIRCSLGRPRQSGAVSALKHGYTYGCSSIVNNQNTKLLTMQHSLLYTLKMHSVEHESDEKLQIELPAATTCDLQLVLGYLLG